MCVVSVKLIYGLKQAPRAWFDRFSSFLLTLGFVCSSADSSLFIFRSSHHVILLLVYVDDIILTSNHTPSLNALISQTWLQILHERPWLSPLFPRYSGSTILLMGFFFLNKNMLVKFLLEPP
jgi:hypothetical protein